MKITEIHGIRICTLSFCCFLVSDMTHMTQFFSTQKQESKTFKCFMKAAFSSQVSVKRGEPPAVQSQVPHSSMLRISFLSDRSQLGPVLSYHLRKIHLAKVAAKERRNQSEFPNPDIFSKSSHTSCTHNFAAAVTF